MTFAVPEPPATPPSGDAETDTRFAEYLADIAARVDDPVCGEEYRGILNDDPQTQRALFDLGEAMAAGTATAPTLAMFATSVATLVLVAVFVFIVGVVA